MNKTKIRKYRNSDLSAVLDLIVDSFESKFVYKQTLTKAATRDILESIWEIDAHEEAYLHYLAFEDQKILGVILVQVSEKKKSDKIISLYELSNMYGLIYISKLLLRMSVLDNSRYQVPYIEHLAVSKDARNKGVGKMLLDVVEEELKHRNESVLSLAVAH